VHKATLRGCGGNFDRWPEAETEAILTRQIDFGNFSDAQRLHQLIAAVATQYHVQTNSFLTCSIINADETSRASRLIPFW